MIYQRERDLSISFAITSLFRVRCGTSHHLVETFLTKTNLAICHNSDHHSQFSRNTSCKMVDHITSTKIIYYYFIVKFVCQYPIDKFSAQSMIGGLQLLCQLYFVRLKMQIFYQNALKGTYQVTSNVTGFIETTINIKRC